MFHGVLGESIIKRGQEKKLIKINVVNIRDFSKDKHRKVDDKPYGGGAGMVFKPEPVFDAVARVFDTDRAGVIKKKFKKGSRVILLTPQGKRLDQKLAKRFAGYKHLVLICGHYEGFDERIRSVVTDEISIGDYILTGGEVPAMAVLDAVCRLIPGVLGHKDSSKSESFESGLLEYPQYTRPSVFCGMGVPKILLSGKHEEIEAWRLKEAVKRTKTRRPDVLKGEKKSKLKKA